jgi:hypothetical protein
VQVLNKIATLYPFKLPPVFTSTWTWINARNPFVLDLNVLPFNCIAETNFHSKLIMMTVAPMICLALIYMYYRLRLAFMPQAQNAENDKKKGDWKALCIRIAILFVLTIFPPVSTTIFQTFNYDQRLGDGSAYLKADYSIEYKDEDHENFRKYAFVMGSLYCVGIPICSLLLLYSKKDEIQKLQVLEHSRMMVDNLIKDEARTALVRQKSALNILKGEVWDVITGSDAPESEAIMRPEEDLSNAPLTVRRRYLPEGSDVEDTTEPKEGSFRSTDSEVMQPQDEAVRSQDAFSNAISSKPQLPLRMRHLNGTDELSSIRTIARQRLVY